MCALGAYLNMRGISSFTHSPSLLYCKFVRIRFFFLLFVSHFTLQLYTTINIRIRAVFFFVCVYVYIYIFLLSPHSNNPSKIQCIFAAIRQWTLSPFFCGFLFICLSFQMEIEKSSRKRQNLFHSMSFFQSLSLSLSFSFFSFDCSEMIKNKISCYFSSVRDCGCLFVCRFNELNQCKISRTNLNKIK